MFSHLSTLLVVLVSFTAELSEQCNPQDKQALLQLKKDFGNPTELSSWVPTTDCCKGDWLGVSCNFEAERVDNLVLAQLDLAKPTQIPSSIGNLPYLVYLNIGFTDNLVGAIPPAFTKLTRLQYLYIRNTNISGQIPHFFSKMKSLEVIVLPNNKLTGTLPPSLSSLPNLTGLSFDRNQITGNIPDSYGSFSDKFNVMTISRNRLTGEIPASLAKLNLAYVDLSRNMLEGDASVLFGSDKSTQKIILTKNLFAFDFGKVGLSEELMILEVSRNRIYGALPKGLTALKNLRRLNVSSNNLCGEIPQSPNLQIFGPSCFSNNKCLCGSPLPLCT